MYDFPSSEHLIEDSNYNQASQHQENALFSLYKQTESQEGQMTLKKISIQIQRELDAKGIDSELIENLQIEGIVDRGQMRMDLLLSQLSNEHNIVTQNKEVLILLGYSQLWVSLGITPLLETQIIELKQFLNIDDRLVIRLKKVQNSLLNFQLCRDISAYMRDGPPTLIEGNKSLEKKASCVKNFQKISYIVRKIIALKTGNDDMTSFRNDRKFSRKSIEDYFYQIKMGHQYGFDFNANSDRNMKHLRKFVKVNEQINKLSRIKKECSSKN